MAGDIEKIFQLSLDLVCIAGADGYFKKINPAFTRVLGYSEKVLLETPFIEFIHPDDREPTMKEVEAQLKGSPTPYFENRCLHKDGSIVWLAWNATAAEDGSLYAIARDVTIQKREEETISFEMHDLREIVESNTDIFYKYNLEGKLIKWNRAMEKLTGLSPQELLHKSAMQCIYEEDRPLVSQKMREMFENGFTLVEARFISASGMPIPYQFNGYLLKDMNGTVTGFAGTGRDISERHKAQVEVKEQLNFVEQLINAIPNPVFYKDRHGRYLGCNKAFEQYIGRTRGEIAGKSVYEISPKELADRYYAADKALFDNPGVQTYEAKVQSVDGELKDVLFNKALFNKSDGSCGGLVGVITDITERKRMENELRRTKEQVEAATLLKDKFVSLVAHDLRSPLATISMMLNTALSNIQGARYGQSADILKKVNGVCETMMEMTVNLLDAAKLQTGDIRLNRKMCGIKNICDGIIADLNYLAAQKGIALKNDVPHDARLYADRILLQRVMHNLVMNAVKFSNKGGMITVFLAGGNSKELAVKDTGTGIHESLLPGLFKYEVKTTTAGTAGERGTGFGLPMSMDIIKAHGGTIRVTSRIGEGSVFFVGMPDTKPPVLVADDDENTVFILRAYLENMGAEVLTAKNGAEALEIVQRRDPALVISDLAMPVMDGLALLQNLKNSAKYSHIPVIIITGNRSIGIRQSAFEHRADDFITKPLSEPDFIPRIGRFITA